MKKALIVSVFLFVSIALQAQTNILECYTSKQIDSLKKVCVERGHIKSGIFSSTLVYCEPVIIDTDSTTVVIYPACNETTYICGRCGQLFTEIEKERRDTTWKKRIGAISAGWNQIEKHH